jgi:hypothetical protein
LASICLRVHTLYNALKGRVCTFRIQSIWEAGENRAEVKSVYRAPGNVEFNREKIVKGALGSGHTAYERLWRYDSRCPEYLWDKLQRKKKVHPIEERERFRWLGTL